MAKYGPWFAADYPENHLVTDLPGFVTYGDAPGTINATLWLGTVWNSNKNYWRTSPFSGANGGILLDGVLASEAEVLFQMFTWTATSRSTFAALKVSSPDPGYPNTSINQYRLGVRGGQRSSEKYTAGTFASINNTGGAVSSNQYEYYWVKARAADNVQEVTSWPATPSADYGLFTDYEAPPYGPQLVTNDTTHTGPGGVGIGFRGESGMGIYWFSIGTDGDPAPIPGEVVEPTARRRPLIWVPY